MKVLIDPNVFLDVEQKRQPFYTDSANVLSEALSQRFEAWMPAHCLTTLHYLIERYADTAAANQAVDWHLKHFRIPPLDETVFKQARTLGMDDFEDAVVAASAQQLGGDWIVTRNVGDFRNSPVPAISPTDFLLQLDSLEAQGF